MQPDPASPTDNGRSPSRPEGHARAENSGDAALHQQVVELEWLRDVSRQVNAARTLDAVLDVVYNGIRSGLGYDRVGIQLFDREQGVFEERRGTDAQGRMMCPTDRAFDLAPDALIWQFPDVAAVLGGAEFYYTSDAVAETPLELRYMLDGAPTHQLVVPLRAGEKVIGLISVDNLLSGAPITPADAGPLLALANQVGTAVERAHAFTRAESLADEAATRSAALATSEERLRAVITNAPVILIALDPDGVCILSEGKGLEALGRRPGEMVGRSIFDSYASRPEVLAKLRLALSGESQTTIDDVGGAVFETRWTALRDAAGACQGVIAVATNITERIRAEEALRHQALHDTLTGLPNRALFHDRLQQALHAAMREHHPLALLLLDLDRFKEVNDTLGHHHGDLLLQQAAGRVRGALRDADTVARLGGDEFAVLLPTSDQAGAILAARRILAPLDEPFVVEGETLDVGASIGIALAPEHGEDAQALLRRADVAMYVAKRTHGGYAVYDAGRDEHSLSRLTIVGDLRRAIAEGQLILHYQPLVNVRSGSVHLLEALVRWPHPEHGLIPPDQFISMAEKTGLIAPLTRWVLDAALAQIRAWQDGGLDLGVAVNLSMSSVHDPQLPDTVAGLLRRHAVEPGKLTLELTESTLMADPAQAMAVLTRVATLGVRLAIDDFGTGYSSLAYLKQLPVHEVKIDRSFVRRMGSDPKDVAIVRSINELGHNLGLAVVAEGVEDRAAWELLGNLDCDSAQGFFLGRPLPAHELAEWLSHTHARGAA